jgi:hypothetical protein
MSPTKWPRLLAGGVVWAAVYNLIWGLAWFLWMHREWLAATAAINRTFPWNEIWIIWGVFTLPLGIVAMAYIAKRAPLRPRASASIAVAFAIWLPLTVGMVASGWQSGVSFRTTALDSTVNLVALLLASLAGGWSQSFGRRRSQPTSITI